VHVRLLLANRRSPEAAALFQTLMRYIHKRVKSVSRSCGRRLATTQQEEVVSEVMLQLMRGSLARFRGDSLAELLGFVRTVTDRCTWRTVRRHERDRATIAEVVAEGEYVLVTRPPGPADKIEFDIDSPLPAADQTYLQNLLAAGSKAELARRSGVSRAAVTQRIQRIRARVSEMAMEDRHAHDAWMKSEARVALSVQTT
jgi:DNA-directed RNA polymerase specialized sigma24 family protein